MDQQLLERPIVYLKGVGPKKGEMLNKELAIFTFADLLSHFPYRYVDKTSFYSIASIQEEGNSIQLRGILRSLKVLGDGRKRRLVGRLRDSSGVTQVKISPDLGLAKIYLSVYNTENKQAVILLMEESQTRLRQSLAYRIKRHVRKIPHVNFYLDDTLDEMYRIGNLFGKLHQNDQMGEEDK